MLPNLPKLRAHALRYLSYFNLLLFFILPRTYKYACRMHAPPRTIACTHTHLRMPHARARKHEYAHVRTLQLVCTLISRFALIQLYMYNYINVVLFFFLLLHSSKKKLVNSRPRWLRKQQAQIRLACFQSSSICYFYFPGTVYLLIFHFDYL